MQLILSEEDLRKIIASCEATLSTGERMEFVSPALGKVTIEKRKEVVTAEHSGGCRVTLGNPNGECSVWCKKRKLKEALAACGKELKE